MGQSALSVADSVKLSKKYDTGTPYGQKIFFGFQRPNGGGDVSPDPIIQNQCTTATIFTAGSATNQIGQNTQFLTTGNNVNNASKGCIVVFKTAIDG
jgi:hypothetical protein